MVCSVQVQKEIHDGQEQKESRVRVRIRVRVRVGVRVRTMPLWIHGIPCVMLVTCL